MPAKSTARQHVTQANEQKGTKTTLEFTDSVIEKVNVGTELGKARSVNSMGSTSSVNGKREQGHLQVGRTCRQPNT